MWTTPSVDWILARWLPSSTSSTISGWSHSASPTCCAWARRRRDEVDPDRAPRARRQLRQPASAAAPSISPAASPSHGDDPERAGLPAADRVLALDADAGGIAAGRSEGEAGFGRFEAIGVGSSGAVASVASLAAAASSSIRVRLAARPPRARPGGIATAVTAAATTNSPTMIEAASRDAQSSSAPTTSGSRNGRSRSASGMNWR